MYVYNPLLQSPDISHMTPSFQIRVRSLCKRYESELDTPHLLIQADHGMGKSAMVHAFVDAVHASAKLSQYLRPLVIGEEHYAVFSLCTLWESVSEQMARLDSSANGLRKEIRHCVEMTGDPKQCLELLRYHLNAREQVLVLAIENVDRLVRKLEPDERRQLKQLMKQEPRIRILGTMRPQLKPAPKHIEPLLSLFDRLRLGPLDEEEATLLVTTTAQQFHRQAHPLLDQRPWLGRVWQRITGGNPRLLVRLGTLIDPNDDDPVSPFLKLFDATTPDFQHFLDKLPAQQQAIIHVLAQHWEAGSAGVVAARLRLPSKLVSAQLNQLYQAGVVIKRGANQKNHFYMLRDRQLNLWYLFRHGADHDRERLNWYIRFLTAWCAPRKQTSEEDDPEREAALIQAAKEGRTHGWMRLYTYYQTRDRIDEAEVALKKGVEAADAHAMHALARHYYSLRGNKKIALALSRKAFERLSDKEAAYTHAMVLLWNGEAMESINVFRDVLDPDYSDDHLREIVDYLLQLAADNQLEILDRLFWDNPMNIKDRFKPVYHVLMHLLRDRYPHEHKRIAPEMDVVVEELLESVEQRQDL